MRAVQRYIPVLALVLLLTSCARRPPSVEGEWYMVSVTGELLTESPMLTLRKDGSALFLMTQGTWRLADSTTLEFRPNEPNSYIALITGERGKSFGPLRMRTQDNFESLLVYSKRPNGSEFAYVRYRRR